MSEYRAHVRIIYIRINYLYIYIFAPYKQTFTNKNLTDQQQIKEATREEEEEDTLQLNVLPQNIPGVPYRDRSTCITMSAITATITIMTTMM